MRIEEPDPYGRTRWTRRLLARGAALVVTVLLVSAVAGSRSGVRASEDAVPPSLGMVADEVRALTSRLETTRGELAIARAQVDRANLIFKYSERYQIPADLASSIYDIALSESIDPDVGFRLVKIESEFKPKAFSNMGAIGYTQIQPGTAKFYEPGLSPEQLYDRDVNLRIGFRFLRDLTRRYNGDLELALVAYNRGPGRVEEILLNGGDPSNGYAEKVLTGTRHATGAANEVGKTASGQSWSKRERARHQTDASPSRVPPCRSLAFAQSGITSLDPALSIESSSILLADRRAERATP